MAVAKRQGKSLWKEREQRKVWGPQVKQTALLASPIYIGQAQREEKRKHLKRGAQIEQGAGVLLFSSSLSGRLPSRLKDVFSFAYQIKLSCNMEL